MKMDVSWSDDFYLYLHSRPDTYVVEDLRPYGVIALLQSTGKYTFIRAESDPDAEPYISEALYWDQCFGRGLDIMIVMLVPGGMSSLAKLYRLNAIIGSMQTDRGYEVKPDGHKEYFIKLPRDIEEAI